MEKEREAGRQRDRMREIEGEGERIFWEGHIDNIAGNAVYM